MSSVIILVVAEVNSAKVNLSRLLTCLALNVILLKKSTIVNIVVGASMIDKSPKSTFISSVSIMVLRPRILSTLTLRISVPVLLIKLFEYAAL